MTFLGDMKLLFLSTGKVIYDVTDGGHTDGKRKFETWFFFIYTFFQTYIIPLHTYNLSNLTILLLHLAEPLTSLGCKIDSSTLTKRKMIFSPSMKGHPNRRAQREICIPELKSANSDVKCNLTEKPLRIPSPHQDGGRRCKFSKVVNPLLHIVTSLFGVVL